MRVPVALILLALPGLAEAQAQPGSGASWSLPTIGLPLADIGLPLAPIGLPLPALGLPPVEIPRSPTHRPSTAPPPRTPPPNPHRGAHAKPGVVYLVPAYGWPVPPGGAAPRTPAPAPPPVMRPPSTGILWFDLQPPGTAQIYVNDVFIGTPEDLDGGVALEAGTYRIDVRAPGYRAVAFNARIEAGRAITFRDTLQPLAAAPLPEPDRPPAVTPPLPRKPFYLVPGCYLGDVPPAEANLPASCDISPAVTFRP